MLNPDNFLTRFHNDQAFVILASVLLVFLFLKYLKVNYITNHQGNQNHNKASPHTCQSAYYQKDKKGLPWWRSG